MNDDPDIAPPASAAPPRISPLTVAGLRLAARPDAGGIARLVLDEVVPALADAAAVYGAEQLLRGGAPGSDNGGRVAVRRLGTRCGPPASRSRSRDAPSDASPDACPGGSSDAFPDASPDAFPDGEIVVLDPGTPLGRCMSTGEPAAFTSPGRLAGQVRPAIRRALSRYASFLAVPMVCDGATAGFIVLARAPVRASDRDGGSDRVPDRDGGRGPGRARFDDGDIAAAGVLATHAAEGIVAAITMARHRALADSLQRGLLAVEPVRPSGLELAGRCLPMNGQVIGGDWYDIVPLPDGRTGIVIGDVMGHGPEAAGVMAQLRAAARALAQLDLLPAELLRQLDRTIATLRDAPLATCAYAVLDPAAATCTLAAAGHLPAVLALPDGGTRLLDAPSGQSLGLAIGTYGQARVALPPGATIALYTDGLVETRARSFDQGIAVLRTALAGFTDPVEDCCDALIRTLAPLPEDDTTLVLARVPRQPSP